MLRVGVFEIVAKESLVDRSDGVKIGGRDTFVGGMDGCIDGAELDDGDIVEREEAGVGGASRS
jgi:hypothetical protein